MPHVDGSGPARDAIAASLEGGLFIALSMDRKVEMCRLLIKIGSEGSVSVGILCAHQSSTTLYADVLLRVAIALQNTSCEPHTRPGALDSSATVISTTFCRGSIFTCCKEDEAERVRLHAPLSPKSVSSNLYRILDRKKTTS